MIRNEFLNEQVIKELTELIQSRLSGEKLRERLDYYHEYDIAKALEKCEPSQRTKVYAALGADEVAEIFPYFDEEGARLLKELPPKSAAAIIEEMDTDEALEVLVGTDAEYTREVIRNLSAEMRREMRLLASYTPDEIGALMTTNYISISADENVKQAMRSLISQSDENDNINTIYVLDEAGRFYGAIDLKELILAREHTPLEDIITTSYPFVHDRDDIDTCMDWIRDYEEDSIPVLSDAGQLLGVVTTQELVEYLDDENREVYNKFAGISDDDGEDWSKETVRAGMRKRFPWLALLLVLGLGVSGVVGMFESLVAQMAILVSFQSLVLDMAGNVGTQSLAVTIRALMDDDMSSKKAAALIWHEARLGLSNGALLGAMAFVVVGIYIAAVKGMGLYYSFAVSGCVGLSLVLAMAVSSVAGTIIPVFFHKIKIDPAVASGPLITTVNDLVAVISYYGLAWLLLIKIMHLA